MFYLIMLISVCTPSSHVAATEARQHSDSNRDQLVTNFDEDDDANSQISNLVGRKLVQLTSIKLCLC